MLDHNSAVPLYLQIRNALRSEILEKQLKDGEPFYGEIELAERFGVARGTIRQALATLEQEGYIRREKGRGTFISKGTGFDERSSALTIALIVPHCRDSFVPTMLLGVEAAAREYGAHILFRHVESNRELQSQALQEAYAYGASGALLFPVDATHHDPTLLRLLADGFPVVLIDHYIWGVNVDYVISDGYGGMLRAVQHLLGLGYRRIGFVTWDVNRAGEVGRYLGYQQALREWNIEPSPELVCLLAEELSDDLSPLMNYLSAPTRPEAIVTLNDYLAIQVLRACRTLKLRVPQELALVGFDDIDIAAQMEVPLTTVSQPVHEIGAQALRLLVNRINYPQHAPQRIILPTHLVIRESCGATIRRTGK